MWERLYVSQSKLGLGLLGSIRAAEQCTWCHGGDGGELLGAFSYVLKPVRASGSDK
jgi:hypothetical protein